MFTESSTKSGSNTAGIKVINSIVKGFGCPIPIEMIRRKFLDNIVEQGHRLIKRRTRPVLGIKAFASAAAKLEGFDAVGKMATKPVLPVAG